LIQKTISDCNIRKQKPVKEHIHPSRLISNDFEDFDWTDEEKDDS